jgi:Ca2+-binding EF-hand superfamily protein
MGNTAIQVFKPLYERILATTLKHLHDPSVSASVAAEFQSNQEAMLEPIFNEFDSDKNGYLDTKELTELVRKSLEAQREYLPEMMVKMTMSEAERQHATPEARQMMKQMLDSTMSDITSALDQMVEQSDSLVPAIVAGLDGNGDGRISKAEVFLFFALSRFEYLCDRSISDFAVHGWLFESSECRTLGRDWRPMKNSSSAFPCAPIFLFGSRFLCFLFLVSIVVFCMRRVRQHGVFLILCNFILQSINMFISLFIMPWVDQMTSCDRHCSVAPSPPDEPSTTSPILRLELAAVRPSVRAELDREPAS